MKRCLLLVIGLIFVVTACKKKYISEADKRKSNNNGTINARMNGKDWSMPYLFCNYPTGTFGIECRLYNGDIARQIFSIDQIDKNIKGKQKIKQHIQPYINHDCTSIFFATDDDAIEDTYIVDSTADNYVIVENDDPVNKKLICSFQLTLYRENTDRVQVQGLPDTMRFTEGKFQIGHDEN